MFKHYVKVEMDVSGWNHVWEVPPSKRSSFDQKTHQYVERTGCPECSKRNRISLLELIFHALIAAATSELNRGATVADLEFILDRDNNIRHRDTKWRYPIDITTRHLLRDGGILGTQIDGFRDHDTRITQDNQCAQAFKATCPANRLVRIRRDQTGHLPDVDALIPLYDGNAWVVEAHARSIEAWLQAVRQWCTDESAARLRMPDETEITELFELAKQVNQKNIVASLCEKRDKKAGFDKNILSSTTTTQPRITDIFDPRMPSTKRARIQ
jgi:hypothetical protein